MPDAELTTALKQAKSKKMFFTLVPKGAEGKLIVAKKKILPKEIAETKKEIGGGFPKRPDLRRPRPSHACWPWRFTRPGSESPRCRRTASFASGRRRPGRTAATSSLFAAPGCQPRWPSPPRGGISPSAWPTAPSPSSQLPQPPSVRAACAFSSSSRTIFSHFPCYTLRNYVALVVGERYSATSTGTAPKTLLVPLFLRRPRC
jgi:hypothetical protein